VASRPGIAVVAGLVAFGVALMLLSQPTDRVYVDAGVPAPAFTLPRVGAAGAVSLEALRGRVLLVNFWATWCKPCEDEMPSMQRLHKKLAGERFELLAVSIDQERVPIEEFQSRFGLSFPLLHDSDRTVADAWQASRFPESFLVDGDGIVVERYTGPRTWDTDAYVERIRSLVAVLP
jgi:peroxiredoxin